jgi:hypothetical protein
MHGRTWFELGLGLTLTAITLGDLAGGPVSFRRKRTHKRYVKLLGGSSALNIMDAIAQLSHESGRLTLERKVQLSEKELFGDRRALSEVDRTRVEARYIIRNTVTDWWDELKEWKEDFRDDSPI